jgi:hypothetical protein
MTLFKYLIGVLAKLPAKLAAYLFHCGLSPRTPRKVKSKGSEPGKCKGKGRKGKTSDTLSRQFLIPIMYSYFRLKIYLVYFQ